MTMPGFHPLAHLFTPHPLRLTHTTGDNNRYILYTRLMDFWRFAPPDPSIGSPLAGSYNVWLVLLSIVIACFAGLAALLIVNRIINTTDRKARFYWLVAGACAMGCGIWAMHFTGMLSFTLPVPVSYGVDLTLFSLVPAVLASGAAIYTMTHNRPGGRRLQLGALLMAAGIGTMHYTGMEAMHMKGAGMHYDFVLFCLSLVVAHLLAMTAIYIRFVPSVRLAIPERWILPLSAIVMGHAVAGMHYTAMAAARYYPGAGHLPHGLEFSNLAMGTTISGFSAVILILAMIAALVDRRIAESEQGRRIEEARADLILNTTADGILALDREGRIVSGNPAAERIFGCSMNDVRGKPISLYIPEFSLPRGLSDPESENQAVQELREVTGRRADGSLFPVEISMNAVAEADTQFTVVSFRDMSERQRAREAIRRTEERFSIVARATTDTIWDWDLETDSVWWNEGMETQFGYSRDEIETDSSSWTRRIHPDDVERVLEEIHHVIDDGGKEWIGEYRFICKDGSIAHIIDRGFVIRDPTGKPIRMVGGMTDVSDRKKAEAEIEYLAFYDSLTKLPNRTLFQDRLQHAVATGSRTGRHGGLMFLDLDNFKVLNDTLGHDIGDRLLIQVAQRLDDCVREADTVARLGGDEFVILLENLSPDPDEAAVQIELVGEKILDTFHQPFVLDEHEHFSTPSIGIALFGDNKKDMDELLKQADIAMYQAKHSGGNVMRFFDPAMQERVNARVELESELRSALRNSEFVLHYQPQVDVNGRITAAEALVRWQHPQRGRVSPGEFIPLCEETGLIIPLGDWILKTACRQLVAWRARPETARLDLTVNVSANQFSHPEFVDRVKTVLRQTGADPGRLKLELTESVLVANMENTISRMTALRSQGVGFLLDDFGTGYSSLYYLKHLPLDQLKIDQSFVRDILTDSNDAAIARTIIALAQALGLTVVAEGVETEDQRRFLDGLGCHTYQGYLFSRPVPVEEFENLLVQFNGVGEV